MKNTRPKAPPATAAPAFTEAEAELPPRLGQPAEKIAAWRAAHLKKGRDYTAPPGQRILWTLDACARLWAQYALAYPLPGPGRPTPLLSFPDRQFLVSHGQAGRNPQILFARLRGARPASRLDLLRVQVPDAARWPKGRPVPARHLRGDLWELDRSLLSEKPAEG